MKETKRKKSQAGKIVDRWRPRLLLNEWFIDLIYPEDACVDDGGGYNALAEIDVNTVYLKAQIKVFPAWFKAPADVREFAIVHELCHIITWTAKDAMNSMLNGVMISNREQHDMIETMTQRVTNAVFWGREFGK